MKSVLWRDFRMNGRKRRTWRIYIVAILLIYHGALEGCFSINITVLYHHIVPIEGC